MSATKQPKRGEAETSEADEPVERLGRSRVTGKFVLKPVRKAGAKMTVEAMRALTRALLSEKA